MATDVSTTNQVGKDAGASSPPPSEQSVPKLIGGIIDDAQRLFSQHADLLLADVRKDIKEAKETVLLMGAAGGVLAVGGLLLVFTVAHLLHWAIPDLPLWGAYGIVGGLLAVAGGVLFYQGKQKLDKLDPTPENTVKAMKEDVQWKTNPH